MSAIWDVRYWEVSQYNSILKFSISQYISLHWGCEGGGYLTPPMETETKKVLNVKMLSITGNCFPLLFIITKYDINKWALFKLCTNRWLLLIRLWRYIRKPRVGGSNFTGRLTKLRKLQRVLTLNAPCISESSIEIKIKFNFYFYTSLWCHKTFCDGL